MSRGLSETILRAHSKSEIISPGETIYIKADLMHCDDYSLSRVFDFYEKMQGKIPREKDKLIVTFEHFIPPLTFEMAALQQSARRISQNWNLEHFYEIGRSGLSPFIAVSKGLVKPGMLIVSTNPTITALGGLGCYATFIGAGDMAALWRKGEIHLIVPHVTNVKATGKKQPLISSMDIALFILKNLDDIDDYQMIELHGDGFTELSTDGRLELAFLVSKKSANAVYIPPSNSLYAQLNIIQENKIHGKTEIVNNFAFSFDMGNLEPLIASSSRLKEIVSIEQFEKTELDIVIIGGGMSGALENMETLDGILSGKKIHKKVRMLVYPGSSEIFLSAVRKGIVERLSEAGAMICPPGQGVEGYGLRGLISKDEYVLTNGALFQESSFGSAGSGIYFAGIQTCVASAIVGRIAHPSEVI